MARTTERLEIRDHRPVDCRYANGAYELAMRFLVVDQNFLRDPELSNRATSVSGGGPRLALPEAALLEMFKSPSACEVAKRSLAQLAKSPTSVVVLKGIPELLRREQTERVPQLASVVDDVVTQGFREVLLEIHRGHGRRLDHIRTGHTRLIEDFGARLDADRNRADLLRWVDVVKSALTPDEVRSLRRGPPGLPALVAALRGGVGVQLVRTALMGAGCAFPPDVAHHLASRPSIASIYALGSVIHAAVWISDGGVEGLSGNQCTNDRFDGEYVAFSAMSVGILSHDKRVLRRASILRQVMNGFGSA